MNYWEDLFVHLANKVSSVKIVVLADITLEGSRQTADNIETIFESIVNVYNWDALTISEEMLKDSPHDVICTTFSIPNLPGKEIFTIISESYQKNFQSLETVIDQIRYQEFKKQISIEE